MIPKCLIGHIRNYLVILMQIVTVMRKNDMWVVFLQAIKFEFEPFDLTVDDAITKMQATPAQDDLVSRAIKKMHGTIPCFLDTITMPGKHDPSYLGFMV